jgi:hypothetical protein
MEIDRPGEVNESAVEKEELARGDGRGWVFAEAGEKGESCAGGLMGKKKKKGESGEGRRERVTWEEGKTGEKGESCVGGG